MGFMNYVFKAMVLIMALLVAFETFHVFLMIVTVDLKLRDILKNCFLFSILNLVWNFFAVYCLQWVFYGWNINFFRFSMFIFPFIGMTLPLFIITFNAYPVVKKYAIDPYYEKNRRATKRMRVFLKTDIKI